MARKTPPVVTPYSKLKSAADTYAGLLSETLTPGEERGPADRSQATGNRPGKSPARSKPRR